MRVRNGLVLALGFALGCGRSFVAPGADGKGTLHGAAAKSQVAPGESTQVVAQDGQPPYGFDFVGHLKASGPDATIDADTGLYTAGTQGSATDQILIQDSAGHSYVVPIVVGSRVGITASKSQVARGERLDLRASGGTAHYWLAGLHGCFELGDGGCSASVESSGQNHSYRTDLDFDGPSDTVTAHDDVDGGASVDIALGARLEVSPQPSVPPGGQLTLQAAGGLPPFTFRFARHGNLSGASISAGGIYVAGANPDVTDVVEAVDSVGATAQQTIRVGDRTFQLPPEGAYTLYRANLNGDAYADVIAVSTSAGFKYVQTFIGSVDGLLPVQSFSPANAVVSVLVGDVNGDGLDDVLLGTSSSGISDADGYSLLLGNPAGLLTPRLSFSVASADGGSLAGVPTLVTLADGVGGVGHAFAFGSDDGAGHAALLLLGLPAVDGYYPTQIGALPLQQLGVVPGALLQPGPPDGGTGLDFLLTAQNDDGGASRLLAYEKLSDTYGTCDDCAAAGHPGSCPLTSMLLSPAADGGQAAQAVAHQCLPVCVDCNLDSSAGRLAVGTYQQEDGDTRAYLLQYSLFSSGMLTTLEPTLSSSGTTFTLPSAHSVDVVSSHAFSQTSVRVDAVGGQQSVEYALVGGQLATVPQPFATFLTSSVATPVTGRDVNDFVGVDDHGLLTVQVQGIHGQYSEGNRFGFVAYDDPTSLLTQGFGLFDLRFVDYDKRLVAADFDRDGADDILVAGRDLQLFSGAAAGGLASNDPVLRGAQFYSVAAGRDHDAWVLLRSPGVGLALGHVQAAADAGTYALDAWGLEDAGLTGLQDDAGLDINGLDAIDLGNGWTQLTLNSGDEEHSIIRSVLVDPSGGARPLGDLLDTHYGHDPMTPVVSQGASFADIVAIHGGLGSRTLGVYRSQPDGGYPAAPTDLPDPIADGCFKWNPDLHSFALHSDGGRDHVAGSVVPYGEIFGICDYVPGGDVPWFGDPATGQVWMPGDGGLPDNVNALRFYAAADLDGDGNTDLVYVMTPDTGLSQDLLLAYGRGDGSFRFQTLAFHTPLTAQLDRVVPGDFNGDGRVDLVLSIVHGTDGSLSILYNAGDGGFY